MGDSHKIPVISEHGANGNTGLESADSKSKPFDLHLSSLNSLTDNLKQIFDCEAATLFAYDVSKKELFSRNFRSRNNEQIRVGISTKNLAGFVAATGRPLNIENVHSRDELAKVNKDLSYDDSWDKKNSFTTRSLMVIPLPHQNKLVGVMEIINKSNGGKFSEADFMKAKAISPMMGLAISKLDEQESSNGKSLRKKIDQEERIRNLSHAIHSAKNLDEILLDLKNPLMDVFNAEACTIFAVAPESDEIFSKLSSNDALQTIRLPINHSSISGYVAAEQRLVNIKDVSDSSELKKYSPDLVFDGAWDEKSKMKTRSLLTIPLIHKNTLMGVLQLINKKDEDSFNAFDENNAFLISETLALAFHNLEKFVEPSPTKYSYLIQNGFLTEDELTLTMARARKTGKDTEVLLLGELYLRSMDIGKSLERFYQMPYNTYDDTLTLPDPEILGLDIDLLRKETWVPLKYDDTGMVVLVNDPSDQEKIEKIKQRFPQQNIEFRVGLKMDIHKYINSFYADEELPDSLKIDSPPEEGELEDLSLIGDLDLVVNREFQDITSERKPSSKKSSHKVFDEIVSIALKQGVTDIHIEPGGEGRNILVRLRKEGACRVFEEIPAVFQKDIISHIKNLAGLDPSTTNLPQNGKFEWTVGRNKYELKAVVFPTIGDQEDAMLRVSPIGKPVPSFIPLTQMGIADPNLDKIMSRIHSVKGMVVLTGPEGTGKTTTLHALLGHLNTPDKKIVTAENPVEIVQMGLRQIQINDEVGLNYQCAVETFLMGSPDVILVGDVEDEKELGLCLEASRQHLVFTSLKAKSAMDCIRMMRELNGDPSRLADAILLIMAQKLVPGLCHHCKEDYHPSKDEFNMLVKFYGEANFSDLGIQYNDSLKLKRAVGCKQCIFTGYSDEIALQEVLERTPELNRLIAEKAPLEEIHNQALKDGMITLNQDGIYKIFNGDCDFKKIQEAFLPGRYN